MSTENLLPSLTAIRNYFNSGATRSYDFRITQLKKFKQAVLAHEKEINDALYADLKKSPEEAYASELGLLLAELNVAIKNLRVWMQP